MARRRHQNPKPIREGLWWYLRVWEYSFVDGKQVRKLKRIKLAEASKKEREVKKIADEIVRPINHGQITFGAAVNFGEYVKDNGTYMTAALSLRPKAVQKCYTGVINKYLNLAFENTSLAEISLLGTQAFFAELPGRGIAYPTIVKIRDAFSHVLRSAVKFRHLTENPMKGLELPADPRGVIEKPFIYPHQFEALLELIPEPYSTMVFVAVWTGLRVSELAGLKWHNIEANSISVERRFCRGEWRAPKTNASAARVVASDDVLARIHRLKTLEVEINWGGQAAKKKFKVVKSDGPDDLVFQSLKEGKPMNDGNILNRFIKPAANRQSGVLGPGSFSSSKLRKIAIPAGVLLLIVVVAGLWMTRPLQPPRILSTTQLTRDGVPKDDLLTDGSRIYISEVIGPKHHLLQGSSAGGETSPIPNPFVNPSIKDVSPDKSQLLVFELSSRNTGDGPAWILPLPAGSPRRLANLEAHDGAWSPDGKQIVLCTDSGLWLADSDGLNARRIAVPPGIVSSARFSPDGSRLRFTLQDPKTNSSSLWGVQVDGKDPLEISRQLRRTRLF